MSKLFLPQYTQNITLIFVIVETLSQGIASIFPTCDAGIMTGCQIIGIQCKRILLKEVKTDMTIALQTRIRCYALTMLVDKKFNNGIAENFFGIQHIKRYPNTSSDPTGISHL